MDKETATHIMKIIDTTEADLRMLEHRLYGLRMFVGGQFYPELKVGFYEDSKPCDSTPNAATDQIKEV